MAIKINTSLVGSWLSADASRDRFMKEELALNKLGELLVKDKADVVNLLRGRGVDVTIGTPGKVYVEHVIEQAGRSEDFSRSLVDLMLKKNATYSADAVTGFLGSDQGQQAAISLTKIVTHLLTNKPSDVKESMNKYQFSDTGTVKKVATWGFSLVVVLGIAALAWILLDKKGNAGQPSSGGI